MVVWRLTPDQLVDRQRVEHEVVRNAQREKLGRLVIRDRRAGARGDVRYEREWTRREAQAT
jgi:hypothetical protein